MEIMRL